MGLLVPSISTIVTTPYVVRPVKVWDALQGNLISYFENSFMRSASRHEDVPELTDLQKRALKAVEDLADSSELRMDYVLQAGDIQLLHNHSIVHARTAYVDHDNVSDLTFCPHFAY